MLLQTRPQRLLLADGYASSCLIMFHAQCLVVRGVGNIMFFEQGLPPLLPCMWQVN